MERYLSKENFSSVESRGQLERTQIVTVEPFGACVRETQAHPLEGRSRAPLRR
jgi:hypothetical protein